MIVTVDKSFAQNGWGHVGMFLQNLWLAAINEDLGVCLQESWSIYPKTVKKVINHPDNEMVWCGVAMGYPNNEDPINNYRTSRDSLDSFASFIANSCRLLFLTEKFNNKLFIPHLYYIVNKYHAKLLRQCNNSVID